MFNIKKFISAWVLVSFSVNAFATTAFGITPLTTRATVESVGQTSVQYTVINNALAPITNISVTPSWNSTGVALSSSNDTCSGQTLGHAQTCTFDIAIPGANQSSGFTIQPKVCGFNKQLCSQSASTFSVSVVQHTLPLRIYEVMFSADASSEELVGINIADTSDIIRSRLSTPSANDGPLAISPDGSTVYMVHEQAENLYTLLVFDVTATGLTQTETSYNLSYEGNALTNPSQLAITPNGNTLYVTNNGYGGGDGYPVYKIDLSSSNYTTAVTAISDDTTGNIAQSLKGIVISPDGETVYVGNAIPVGDEPGCDIFNFSTSPTTTSLSTLTHETTLTAISALLLSSDGSTLYAAGQSPAENFPATIEQYNIADSVSTENAFLPTPAVNGTVLSAALSPDNATIYSITSGGGTFLLYSIDTTDMSAPAGTTYPFLSVWGMSNFNYIAYSPDSSTVSILNYGNAGKLTALFNPNSPDNVTTVNPAGGNLTMYTHTRGSFIN